MVASGARRAAATALVTIALAVPAPLAWAHEGGGRTIFTGVAGPYTVYTYDGLPDGPRRLLYRLVLVEAATKTPLEGATVIVQASSDPPSRSEPLTPTVTSLGNVHSFALPDLGADGWQVRATITGPAGSGTTAFYLHGSALTQGLAPDAAASSRPPSGWVAGRLAVGSAVGVALVIAVAVQRRGRSRADASVPAVGEPAGRA